MSNFNTYTGWAVEERSKGPLSDGPHLQGRYAFMRALDIPAHMEGHRIALFKSRALARAACISSWSANGNRHWYVPVKVIVKVMRRAAG